ncbi:ABC transporter permease [Natrarchaeobius chitinivorans]|uniref:ABC transporter permease n=1 Tax=Natrarchaeobius chitinivorans TaxID=1679083 RepID=A0A3N6MCI0_NATCH|nr:ABC transporter permease [Natrarchaeobius chitinivorans]RQG94240.1 ABC transporter permease [Natrarchaeobius chitinivorans]
MNWWVKRTGQALFTIWAVVTITFVLIRGLPGDPGDRIREQAQRHNPDMSQAALERLIEARIPASYDDPVHVAYWEYLTSVMRGDLGYSTFRRAEVAPEIASVLPWTVLIMSLSTALMFAIGLGLGALMAYKEGSRFDTAMTGASIFFNSIPYYVAAVLLIAFLGYRLSVFPARGTHSDATDPGLSAHFIFDALYHATLPTLSFVITGFGIIALTMRGNSIQTLGEEYIRVAKLRGIPDRRIALRYVGRNAILPMWTTLLISIGFMFGGAIILEEIFQYRGMGWLMFRSIEHNDIYLMMGTFLIVTIAVVIALWIADATYGWLDPRIKSGDDSESY